MDNHLLIRTKRFSGFTLVELIVVLFIAGLLFSIASLSLTSRSEQREIELFVRQLTQKLQLAGQIALLEPAEIGFSFRSNRYEFFELQSQADQLLWVPLRGLSLLKPQPLISNIQASIRGADNLPLALVESAPPIQFFSNGNLTPFRIVITGPSNAIAYEIVGNRTGEISFHETS